ncbi:MAG: GAF domain-containing protein [Candidatus Heimdallarchaeaceae archaeon]
MEKKGDEDLRDHIYDLQLNQEYILDDQMRENLRILINSFPFYVMIIDEDHHIQIANNIILNHLKMDFDSIVGCYCPYIMHESDTPYPGCPLVEAIDKLKAIEREFFCKKQEKWIRSAVYPTNIFTQNKKRLFIHLTIDITAQKTAEAELKRSEEKNRQNVIKLQKLNDLHTKLNEMQKILIYERDKNALVRDVCSKLSEFEDYDFCWIGILDSKNIRILVKSNESQNLPEIIDFRKESQYSCLEEVIEQKQLVIVDNHSQCNDCLVVDQHKHKGNLFLPMFIDDEIYGIISLHKKNQTISESEKSLLQVLSNCLAFSLHSLDLVESQNKAFNQLRKNRDYLEHILDKIRNPLTAIQGFVELYMENKKIAEIIIEYIEQIVDTLSKVDKSYIESFDLYNEYEEKKN